MVEARRQKRILVFVAFAAFLIIPVLTLYPHKAFADGLTQENLPPASVGNRDASLFVKINPPVLTSESKQDAFMQFRLFDANTNQTIKWTTFRITVTKGTDENAKPLLSDFFQTESGVLTLKIQPTEGPMTIFGNQDPFLNAWVADPGGTVNIRGPVLLDGGLYHFQIEIFGIDNPRNIFKPEDAPKFDSWLSVGDVFRTAIQHDGQTYNTTIISYYDKVQDFKFNSGEETFNWAMPFDWNATRLQKTNIFVHEEVKIPKSLAGVGNAASFAATVNNEPISGRMLIVDPYTSETDLVLHYLLNKNDIVKMANQVPSDASQMTFSLAPSTEANIQTTGEMSTDTGGINVAAEWTPSQLNANSESTVKLDFSDAFSGEKITSDIIYDLRILDSDGNVIYSKTDLTAMGGSSTQTIDFPKNGNYRIEIEVKGLVTSSQTVDKTRSGIARGIVVVPEFPAGALLAAAGVIGAVLALQKFARKMPSAGLRR